jgi:hypothetical protein
VKEEFYRSRYVCMHGTDRLTEREARALLDYLEELRERPEEPVWERPVRSAYLKLREAWVMVNVRQKQVKVTRTWKSEPLARVERRDGP